MITLATIDALKREIMDPNAGSVNFNAVLPEVEIAGKMAEMAESTALITLMGNAGLHMHELAGTLRRNIRKATARIAFRRREAVCPAYARNDATMGPNDAHMPALLLQWHRESVQLYVSHLFDSIVYITLYHYILKYYE